MTGYPIVTVRKPEGGTAQAELRETRPNRPDIVKVVYVESRTASWIKRSRIVDLDGGA